MLPHRIVVFTGHRDIRDGHHKLISEQAKGYFACAEFVVGGALGADTLVLHTICDGIEAGEVVHQPTIIVPDYVRTMPRDARLAVERAIIVGSPNIIELGRGYTAVSLKGRNVEMLKYAQANGIPSVLAYWCGQYKSGTWSAMCSAERMEIPVEKVLLDA